MFYLKSNNNVKVLKSDIFSEKIVHAFSTRIGGKTPTPLDSFSMGTSGLEGFDEHVKANRNKISSLLGIENKKLFTPKQKHTENIAVIEKNNLLNNICLEETDGIITNRNDITLMLLFADCTPIILFSDKHNLLGVIHAGWRGTAKGITAKAVKIFVERFGVDASEIKAAVGPAIGQCCYPVSKEVAEQLNMSMKGSYDNIFFENKDSVRVDLKALNSYQLIETGVKDIDVTDYCTSCNNDIFYSYRANNGKTGRHCAIASIV